MGVFARRGPIAANLRGRNPGSNVPVPGTGRVLLGALVATSTGKTIADREADTGRVYDIHLNYYDWGNNLIGAQEAADARAGRIPQLSWYGPGSTSGTAPYQLADVVNGVYDTYIAAQAERVRNYRHPIFIRWGEEMNGNWYTGYSGNPTDYVAAYQRIVTIFRSVGATNVSWVWAPDTDNSKSTFPVMNYYPGDAYIDWVGGDGYSNAVDTLTFSRIWGTHLAAVRAVTSKPFMLSEFGCDNTLLGGLGKDAWIKEMHFWLTANADLYGIKALCWFDTNTSSSGTDYRVDSTTASYDAWKAFAGSALMGGPNANLSLTPPGTGSLVLSDTFTRADGAVGSAETGQAWTATGYTISSGKLAPTGTTTAYAFVDIGIADCWLSWIVEAVGGNNPADGGMARYVDTTHHFFYRGTSGGLFVANGSGAASVATYSAGFIYRDTFWLHVVGATVTVYRNGVQVGQYTSLPNTTATKVGFRTATNTFARYDNVQAWAA